MPCRVSECQEQHTKHYCRVCKLDDADHFSMNCPSPTFYHGTNIENAQKIGMTGWIPSSSGRLGEGIYMTDNFEQAARIAEHRTSSGNGVVFHLKVQLGKMIDMKRDSDANGTWRSSFDSCTAIHPPWCGPEFHEWCVKDSKHILITRVTFYGNLEVNMNTECGLIVMNWNQRYFIRVPIMDLSKLKRITFRGVNAFLPGTLTLKFVSSQVVVTSGFCGEIVTDNAYVKIVL